MAEDAVLKTDVARKGRLVTIAEWSPLEEGIACGFESHYPYETLREGISTNVA